MTEWPPSGIARASNGVFHERRANVRRQRLGQPNDEATAPASHTIHGYRAAVRHGNAPGDSQAQPDPRVTELAGRLGAIKRLEDAMEVLRRAAAA